ncbi:hypothetical protein O3M35_003834 [Rhynocoris fuscipes]|uniref:GDNF/GAS1 domain-containing protein n=1 Tax=Rhynocoris fuscipes TaxID=488301 RepID=A0AAW1CHK3_9HEMI
MIGCSALQIHKNHCPEECQHALIALTSTNEGKELMKCECGDDLCRETKARVEVCRPQVIRATRAETVVNCEVAQWICMADTLCSTALRYYNIFCRSMFTGRKCSLRCKNSINILRRQEKAAKLNSCVCTGREDYDCPTIRSNMEQLCFNKSKHSSATSKTITLESDNDGQSADNETNDMEKESAGFAQMSTIPLSLATLLIQTTVLLIRYLELIS